MRTANVAGRLAVVSAVGHVDVAKASSGRFEADPQTAFDRWRELQDWWLEDPPVPDEAVVAVPAVLGPPVPRPRQVFAVGLNYRAHAAESRLAVPEQPAVFTKFPTCLTGQDARVVLPSARVDWEVELVVVVGGTADRVREDSAWGHVAGLSIGQDLSERDLQLAGPAPQFSLGKSFAGFGPVGPAVVTVDELSRPDDLAISCSVNGETVQKGRTSDMIFSVPELVARLSAVCVLLPGDLIFTGTPAGVGLARTPPRFIAAGDRLVSCIDGLGELRTTFVARS